MIKNWIKLTLLCFLLLFSIQISAITFVDVDKYSFTLKKGGETKYLGNGTRVVHFNTIEQRIISIDYFPTISGNKTYINAISSNRERGRGENEEEEKVAKFYSNTIVLSENPLSSNSSSIKNNLMTPTQRKKNPLDYKRRCEQLDNDNYVVRCGIDGVNVVLDDNRYDANKVLSLENIPLADVTKTVLEKHCEAKMYGARIEQHIRFFNNENGSYNTKTFSDLSSEKSVIDKEKGIIGELVTELTMISCGYRKLLSTDESNNGFDGVFVCDKTEAMFITESKYRTKDGARVVLKALNDSFVSKAGVLKKVSKEAFNELLKFLGGEGGKKIFVFGHRLAPVWKCQCKYEEFNATTCQAMLTKLSPNSNNNIVITFPDDTKLLLNDENPSSLGDLYTRLSPEQKKELLALILNDPELTQKMKESKEEIIDEGDDGEEKGSGAIKSEGDDNDKSSLQQKAVSAIESLRMDNKNFSSKETELFVLDYSIDRSKKDSLDIYSDFQQALSEVLQDENVVESLRKLKMDVSNSDLEVKSKEELISFIDVMLESVSERIYPDIPEERFENTEKNHNESHAFDFNALPGVVITVKKPLPIY